MINFDILKNTELKKIVQDFDINLRMRDMYEFNIFSISTYGKQLENFHSDIIAELIDPNGKHNEKNVFFNNFIEFLNSNGANIEIEKFDDVVIKREKGRIDIAILNNSNEIIIIENKINGAVDADEQLEKYYQWSINNGFKVICVVYLTLSGEKNAPPILNSNIKPLNITAFSNSSKDLVNGWIIPTIGKCRNFDSASFLKQYSKLLISLSYNKMNSELYEKFYKLSDDMAIVKEINDLKQIVDELPKIRMDKLVNKITDFSPFTKSYRYKPYHMLYEKFIEDDNYFKLDISFAEDGSAYIHFWNPNKQGTEAFESVKAKIEQIGYQNILSENKDNWIGFFKRFNFSDYNSLEKLDNNLLDFVKEFMIELKKSKITKA